MTTHIFGSVIKGAVGQMLGQKKMGVVVLNLMYIAAQKFFGPCLCAGHSKQAECVFKRPPQHLADVQR